MASGSSLVTLTMNRVNWYSKECGSDMGGSMLRPWVSLHWSMSGRPHANMRQKGTKFGSHQKQHVWCGRLRWMSTLLITRRSPSNLRCQPSRPRSWNGLGQRRYHGKSWIVKDGSPLVAPKLLTTLMRQPSWWTGPMNLRMLYPTNSNSNSTSHFQRNAVVEQQGYILFNNNWIQSYVSQVERGRCVSTIPWLARLFGIGSNNSDGCKAYAMRWKPTRRHLQRWVTVLHCGLQLSGRLVFTLTSLLGGADVNRPLMGRQKIFQERYLDNMM